MNDTDKNEDAKHREIIFCTKTVRKDHDKLPDIDRDAFNIDLKMVAADVTPLSATDQLDSIENGVIELIRNGSPAYRCVYYTKIPGQVVVLYSGIKTTNGKCSKLRNAVKLRLKAYKKALKKL